MLKNINNSFKKLKEQMREVIKDDEQYNQILLEVSTFYNGIIEEIEKFINKEEEKMSKLEAEQQVANDRMNELKERIDNICKDIYADYEDFDIVCPYCNYEFSEEIDEDVHEVSCPKCNNIIELDWSGEPDNDVIDDDSQDGCSGNCSRCGGCDE